MEVDNLLNEVIKLLVTFISLITSIVTLIIKPIQLIIAIFTLIYNKVAHEIELQRIAYPIRAHSFNEMLPQKTALYHANLQITLERARRFLRKLKNSQRQDKGD